MQSAQDQRRPPPDPLLRQLSPRTRQINISCRNLTSDPHRSIDIADGKSTGNVVYTFNFYDPWEYVTSDAEHDLAYPADYVCGVAFKGWVNGTTEAEVHAQVVDWWCATAGHYASASPRLAFDVFIEIGGIMSNGKNVHKTGPRLCPLITLASDPAKLNALYKDVLDAIRLVSPTRVVAMPPGKLDRPWDLHQLQAPRSCGRYCMAEFHIIASGPCVAYTCSRAREFAAQTAIYVARFASVVSSSF